MLITKFRVPVGHSVFGESKERKDFACYEKIFESLVEAVDTARKGKILPVPKYKEGWSVKDFDSSHTIKKLNLLKRGCIVAITLTRSEMRGDQQQLRGWVGHPCFWENGYHADEYGSRGIFELHGSHSELKEACDKYPFAGRRRRFRDEHYVVWL